MKKITFKLKDIQKDVAIFELKDGRVLKFAPAFFLLSKSKIKQYEILNKLYFKYG